MKKVTSFLSLLTITLSTLFFVFSHNVNAAEGKELTDVVTNVSVLEQGNTEVEKNNEGEYKVRSEQAYRFLTEFNLEKYNNNLSEGDYFNLSIPNNVRVFNQKSDLKDNKTQVPIASSEITSNPNNQGGNAKITLKNFDQYLAKTKAEGIKDITGYLSIDFILKKSEGKESVTFEKNAVKNTITHTFDIQKTDGSKEAGFENFAKNGNDVVNKEWTSPKLAEIGAVSEGVIYSPWRIRVNTSAKDYGENLTLVDSIDTSDKYAPIQYIPESLAVYQADIVQGTSALPDKNTKMIEGKDYTVEWNKDYTSLKVILKDGSKSYYVMYNTTTPGDGRYIGNKISLLDKTGTTLPQRSNNIKYTYTSERISKLNQGIDGYPFKKPTTPPEEPGVPPVTPPNNPEVPPVTPPNNPGIPPVTPPNNPGVPPVVPNNPPQTPTVKVEETPTKVTNTKVSSRKVEVLPKTGITTEFSKEMGIILLALLAGTMILRRKNL